MPKITTQPTKRQSLTMLDNQNLEILEDWQKFLPLYFHTFPIIKQKYLSMDLDEFLTATKVCNLRLQKMLIKWYSEEKKVPHKHYMVKNLNNLLK